MPTPDPSRRDDMILPTFVDLEELLFSSMRLHEPRFGSERKSSRPSATSTQDKSTHSKAS